MTTIGFLHTAEGHGPSFRTLLAVRAPELDSTEVIDAALLDDARRRGLGPDVRQRVRRHLTTLRDQGAEVVLCTCSTLGGLAEQFADELGIPVLRVDRPMAQRAAAIGGRIVIVASLQSTLAPSHRLISECVAAGQTEATVVEAPCPEVWAQFRDGDLEGYMEAVAAHVRSVAPDGDVIVLAQASMAPVAQRVSDLPIPVLASPRTAIDAVVQMVRPSAPGPVAST